MVTQKRKSYCNFRRTKKEVIRIESKGNGNDGLKSNKLVSEVKKIQNKKDKFNC